VDGCDRPPIGPGEGMTTGASEKQFNRRMEIITTIILAIASLLTAWSGYEASQWASIQAISLSQASSKRVEASQAASLGGQDRLLDVTAFAGWLNAIGAQDRALADFYRARFRSEFRPAFDAWLSAGPLENPDVPRTPFELSIYRPRRSAQSAELEAEADALFARGSDASDVSSSYVRVTLYMAAALFFAAISKSFEERSLRFVTIGISVALLLFGAVNLLPLPLA